MEKVVVSGPCCSMEQVVLADQENSCKLFVVVCHHDVLWWTLAKVKKSMDILDTAESLLPELELNSDIQLLKSSLQMTLECIWVAEIDGVHLCGVLGRSLNVVSEEFTKSSELSLSSVLLTELEGLSSSALIHDLETCIIAENVENGAVGLPKEL